MPVLTNTAQQGEDPRRGAVWSITEPERELDSNLIRLPPGDGIPSHLGAEVDTLVHVVRGSGTLLGEDGEEPLRPGDVALLPRRTVRGFRAGPDGLEYLTVHRRRQSLQIGRRPEDA
ncbi:cupin [Brachybacterium ginsengisoli]|uniref:Cupin n=1 Tax=Brachybacterium ginsengisoli TaxID=1331682 RepID=A0A291GWR6_9MICO|nr:cupin domain-containing protein [Brachybacterium ginsengisoli]ATG54649.1 cupin [Brachybacterium ginsengisoli]